MTDGYSGTWYCRKLQLSCTVRIVERRFLYLVKAILMRRQKNLDIPVLGKMPIDAGLAEAVEEERFYEISNDYLTDAVNKL